MFFVLRAIVALLGTFWGAASDLKSREVDENATSALIVAGALITLAEYWGDWEFLLYAFGLSGAIFAVGLVAYLTGSLGGGDVKFFVALSLLFPKGENLFPPVFSIVFLATLFCLLVMSLYHLGLLLRDREKIVFGKQHWLKFSFSSLLSCIVLFLFKPLFVVFFPILLGFVTLSFKDIILKKYYLLWLPVSEIGDEEVLALEELGERDKARLELGGQKIFTDRVKKRAKKLGIKKLPIYKNLPPLLPFLFLAVLAYVVWGDLFYIYLRETLLSVFTRVP